MNKKFRRFIFWYSFFSCALLTTIVALNFNLDPYQYYRRNLKGFLYGNDRWQVAGFIKTFDYNQVVIGTSMTQNFPLRYLTDRYKLSAIRLSLAGATIQEQRVVLEAAIKTNKVKQVVWGLDQGYLNYTPGEYQDSFPLYLYTGSVKRHFQYLLNNNVSQYSIKILLRRLFGNPKVSGTLENYNTWDTEYIFSKTVILKQYQEIIQKQSFCASNPNTIENLKKERIKIFENFRRDVLSIIKDNPSIHFIIFFPPYSLANNKISFSHSPDHQMSYGMVRKFIMQELTSCKNVSLFDFETYLPIIADLDNYKDFTHYSKKINHLMATLFSEETCKVTNSNIELYQKKFFALPEKPFQ